MYREAIYCFLELSREARAALCFYLSDNLEVLERDALYSAAVSRLEAEGQPEGAEPEVNTLYGYFAKKLVRVPYQKP